MRLLSVLFLFLLIPFVLAGSVAEDRQALEAIFTSTNGESWTNNNNWLSEQPLGEWYGVQTNEQGRVVRLDLYENNLVGSLPDEIGLLDRVTYLNLKLNSLTGVIPETIGNLESVEWLLLSGVGNFVDKEPNIADNRANHPGKSDKSGNTFTGRVPDSLGNLQNMIVLQLSGSKTYPRIPETIGNASNLIGIFTSWNRNWTEPIPESIGKLSNLKHFYYSRNMQSGSWPRSMADLTELRYVSIGTLERRRMDKDTFPDLSNLQYLRSIAADFNSFDGPFPEYLVDGTLPDVFGLNIAWNNWQGSLPENKQTQLRTFTVTGHSLRGPLPASYFTPRMINTNFGWGEFNGTLPRDLRHMHTIRNLRFPDNYLEGPWPEMDWTNKQNRSSHPLGSFTRAQFNDNKFVPADMLILSDDNRTLFDWYKQFATASFGYQSQKPFGYSESFVVSSGGRFVYNYSHKSHPDDMYVWKNDGEYMTEQTSVALILDDVSASDAGQYTLQITNPYPDISSEVYVSEPITIQIDASGDLEVIGGSSTLHPAWESAHNQEDSQQEYFDPSLYSSPRSGFVVDGAVRVSDTVVYSTGFLSVDGVSWDSFSFDGELRGDWVVGDAVSSVRTDARYYAVFSCSWVGSWDCSDTWQVLER